MTAVATLASHVAVALQYESNQQNMWLGIGRYTPWANEDEPPKPDITNTSLDELIGVKHITKCHLVVPRIDNDKDTGGKPYPPLSANDISYKGYQWAPVSDEDAFKYGARWIYVETQITPEDDIPYSKFRQIGLYMNLQPKPQFSNADSLPANKIQDTGLLWCYDNRLDERYSAQDGAIIHTVAEF